MSLHELHKQGAYLSLTAEHNFDAQRGEQKVGRKPMPIVLDVNGKHRLVTPTTAVNFLRPVRDREQQRTSNKKVMAPSHRESTPIVSIFDSRSDFGSDRDTEITLAAGRVDCDDDDTSSRVSAWSLYTAKLPPHRRAWQEYEVALETHTPETVVGRAEAKR